MSNTNWGGGTPTKKGWLEKLNHEMPIKNNGSVWGWGWRLLKLATKTSFYNTWGVRGGGGGVGWGAPKTKKLENTKKKKYAKKKYK